MLVIKSPCLYDLVEAVIPIGSVACRALSRLIDHGHYCTPIETYESPKHSTNVAAVSASIHCTNTIR